MKFLKRAMIGIVALVVVLFLVLAIFISTLDLNAYKEQIEDITREQTGRDLTINGELDASFFPWVGISIGEVELSNAKGFGDRPFARIDEANVSIEVLPLLRRQIHVDAVSLSGLMLDLQRAADGSTNWDDLMQASATTSTTTDDETTEVEGGAPAIAALAVGGVAFKNANISWLDKQAGLDAQLSDVNLDTGAIELAKPFALKAGFDLISNSLAMQARFDADGKVMLDLEQQKYQLAELSLTTSASGEGVPIEDAELSIRADITADLEQQTVDIASVLIEALGIELQGAINVTALDTDPQITAALSTPDTFSLLPIFEQLGIEAPETADDDVLKAVGLALEAKANAKSAQLDKLTITLDDTTFSGNLSVPDLAGDLPPVRFDFKVDAIDVDRYLPSPPPEGEAPALEGEAPATASAEDTPIDLPLELMRKLDVDGRFAVDDIKVSNLTAKSIVIPVKAKGGVISLPGIAARLYDGKIDSSVTVDARKEIPAFAAKANLDGILAEPLLADLLQDDAPLSGKGMFTFDVTTRGNSVNGLKAKLNGGYNMSFVDGAINGINIAYQLRRARATLRGEKLDEEENFKKTDFSALTMSGTFTNGVLFSDDLDLRAPVLRLGGKGKVDLPQEYVDYTLKTLLSGTSKGQGGKARKDLGGVKLNVPIRGKFSDLSADFTKALVQAMKDDLKAKLKDAENEAKAKLKAEEARAREKLKANEEKLRQQLKEREKREREKLEDKARDALKGLFN